MDLGKKMLRIKWIYIKKSGHIHTISLHTWKKVVPELHDFNTKFVYGLYDFA